MERKTQMAERNTSENIAWKLRRDILSGKLLPGDPVKERDNAAEMGVSRTPMREAIRILAKEGLLILEPSKSPVVANPKYDEVIENVDVLKLLELEAARIACEKASDAELQKIKTLQEQHAQTYEALDKIESFELDMEFHKSIVSASHNKTIISIHSSLLARLWRARYRASIRKKSGTRILRQHKQIADAMLARDRRKVTTALSGHLRYLNIDIRHFFEQEGLIEPLGKQP